MKKESFERNLPEGYEQELYINAKQAKFGIIFNLISLVIMAAVMAIATVPLTLNSVDVFEAFVQMELFEMLAFYGVFILALIAYIVLHELVHGVAYKSLTGEKLTFGISWSCAFCGVPNIYTYKRTAGISVAAPLTVFSLVLIPLTVILYFVNPVFYIASAMLVGLHLGGCSGDVYVMYLLFVKFREKKILMRDTGPEQYFYVYRG